MRTHSHLRGPTHDQKGRSVLPGNGCGGVLPAGPRRSPPMCVPCPHALHWIVIPQFVHGPQLPALVVFVPAPSRLAHRPHRTPEEPQEIARSSKRMSTARLWSLDPILLRRKLPRVIPRPEPPSFFGPHWPPHQHLSARTAPGTPASPQRSSVRALPFRKLQKGPRKGHSSVATSCVAQCRG